MLIEAACQAKQRFDKTANALALLVSLFFQELDSCKPNKI